MGDRVGRTHLVEHVIRTDSPPIKQRYYLSPTLQQVVNQELDEMLEKDIPVLNQAVDTWKEQKYQYYVQLNHMDLQWHSISPKPLFTCPLSMLMERVFYRVNQAVDTWKEQKYQYYVQLNSHGLTVAFHQPKTIVYMSFVHVDGEEVYSSVYCAIDLACSRQCLGSELRNGSQARPCPRRHRLIMEVNRLLSDELTYELQARGLPIGNTVAEKRLLLRESLRQERLGLSTPPTSATWKLGELRRAVGQFDDSNRDNEFRRIYTRLIHVSDRLKRIECVTPLLEAQRASLISDANELVRELNLAYEEAREVVAEELQTKGATVAEHPQIDACVRESLGQDRKDSSLHESMPRDLIDLSDSGSLGAFQATQQDNSLIDMPIDLLPVVLHQQKERNREPPPRNFEVAPREQGCIFRRSFAKLHNDERPTQDQTLSARPSFQACDGIYQTPKELVAASIKEAKSHGTGDRNMGKPDMTYDRSRAQSPLTSTAWNTQPHKYLDSDDICLGSRSNQAHAPQPNVTGPSVFLKTVTADARMHDLRTLASWMSPAGKSSSTVRVALQPSWNA
nr:unnamed protein product [Callosobruchus analis]